jgi:hypothetical protein
MPLILALLKQLRLAQEVQAELLSPLIQQTAILGRRAPTRASTFSKRSVETLVQPEPPHLLRLQVPAGHRCMMAQSRLKVLAVMEGRPLDLQEATLRTPFLALVAAAVQVLSLAEPRLPMVGLVGLSLR